jgi:hypothetical protein
MSKLFHAIIVSTLLLFTQLSFAQASDTNSTDSFEASSPQCEKIVNACLGAGYVRAGAPGKNFWHDCLKPILLGQTVPGVTVDANDVKICRQFKITNMKNQIKEFQKIQSAK